MRLLGNILWFILGGWWNFLLYSFLGVLCCITIIGIPIGKSLFQYAKLMVFPFGKVIVKETDIKGKENVSKVRQVGGLIANIIWLPFGICTFVVNIATMIACAITIIGIPCAIVIAKSCTFLLWPVGAKVITKEEAESIQNQRVMNGTMGTQANTASFQTNTVNKGSSDNNEHLQEMVAGIKAGSAQMFETAKVNGNKAVTTVRNAYENGQDAIKSKQQITKAQVMAEKQDVSLEYLLKQIEVKLYENKIMEWIMPYLEYIVCAVAIVFVIVGGVIYSSTYSRLLNYTGDGAYASASSFNILAIILGMLNGIKLMSVFFYLSLILGVIKQNHILVLGLLGSRLISELIIGLVNIINGWGAVNVVMQSIEVLGLIIMVIACFCIYSSKLSFGNLQTVKKEQATARTAMVNTDTAESYYCSQCGTVHSNGETFCSRCGTKLK